MTDSPPPDEHEDEGSRDSHGHSARSDSAGAAMRRVILLSDGSAPGPGRRVRPIEAALARDVAVLEGLARVPVLAHPVVSPDIEQFVTRIGQLPDGVAAVFLTRTDPIRARAVQRRIDQVGGPPVLSDEDTTAIKLTATTSAYMRRIGRDPLRARILVAGAITTPILVPLLIGTGFLEITMWNSVDAARFPLARAARDADVVIDLLSIAADSSDLVMDRPEGSVISCSGLDDRFLAAPGILRALVEQPAGTFDLGVGLYQICAGAIARATPGRYRPADLLRDRTVTDAVTSALHRAVDRPGAQDSQARWSWRPHW